MTAAYSLPIDAILIIGPTGAGKSPLGDHIARNGFLARRTHHLDFGSELRFHSSHSPQSPYLSPQELHFIKKVLQDGLLLENQHFPLAEKIIRYYLNRNAFLSTDLLILNGIPRHHAQLQDISRIATIHALISLDCPPHIVHSRIRTNIGGDRTGRSDDNYHLVQKKFQIFLERTEPLKRYFEGARRPIYSVSVSESSTPDHVYAHLLDLATANPPITLITKPPQ
jgi:adenylate kinase